MPALVREGYTSVKIYMSTDDDLKIGDRQILDVLEFARAAQIHGDDTCRELRLHRVADRTA